MKKTLSLLLAALMLASITVLISCNAPAEADNDLDLIKFLTEKNEKEIANGYYPNPDLDELTETLKERGYSVRWSEEGNIVIVEDRSQAIPSQLLVIHIYEDENEARFAYENGEYSNKILSYMHQYPCASLEEMVEYRERSETIKADRAEYALNNFKSNISSSDIQGYENTIEKHSYKNQYVYGYQGCYYWYGVRRVILESRLEQ